MRTMLPALVLFALLWSAAFASAAVQSRTITYRHGDTMLEGYLAYDDAITGRRPGVLIFHEWMGPTSYERGRAEQLARLGYVAMVADIYGREVRPANREEAAQISGIYRSDRALLRARAQRALAALLLHGEARVDPKRVAAIGYCFGGMAALELARSGAGLAGVASFHGSLDTPNPADAKNIKGKVLVLHGADDPSVPMSQVTAFMQEMRQAGVDWQINIYSGAVHAFTNPASGNDPSRGAAYNERADRRSWQALRLFFDEIFRAG